MNNYQVLERTKYPELCVNIMERIANQGRIRIVGTAIRTEDASVIEQIAPYTTKPVSSRRKRSAITEAIAAIEAQYYREFGQGPLTEEALNEAFVAVKGKVESGMRLKPTWTRTSTNKNTILFFERNTLKLLKPLLISAKMFLDDDRVALHLEMKNICLRHGSTGEAAAQASAAKHMEEAEIILSHMRDVDDRIPELRLTSSAFKAQPYREEQTKMLPISVLQSFYRIISGSVQSCPYLVFFAVLVIFGLRPAEAAGCKPPDIIWYATHCVVHVQHQELYGRLLDKLKNEYSKRPVIICWWGMLLLKQCCELIGDKYPQGNEAMNRSALCAEWVKARLLEAGATERELKEIGEDIPDIDMDDSSVFDPKHPADSLEDKAKKVSCYVLRRCFATIMRSVMGLSLFETDRMLGHIPVGSRKNRASKLANSDLNSPETQARLAEKMERFVFDPEITRNPAYWPYKTQGEESLHINVAFPKIVIENDEDHDVWIQVNLCAEEPGEALTIFLPEATCSQLHASSLPVSFENIGRIVIGEL